MGTWLPAKFYWTPWSPFLDRKKDLVKLQAGEYVSLGKVESALAQSQYVETICVYAESLYNFVVCLAVPRPKQLKALAVSLGVLTDDWAEQCRSKVIRDAVLKDMQALGKACKYWEETSWLFISLMLKFKKGKYWIANKTI